MRLQAFTLALILLSVFGTQVQGAQQAKKQVPTPNPDPLAGLAPPPANLPPGLSTLNLTQLAPLLPLLAEINASVVASWVPILEAVEPDSLAAWAPVLNLLSANVVEAVVAALPTINVSMVIELVPAVNALNASTLEGYIKVLGQVNPQLVMDLLPSIAILDTDWVNKVVPALTYFSPDYLVAVVRAIAPALERINPDQLVALIPAFSTISVSTWEKLIELLNKLTTAQLEFLVHLLDVTGPYLDKMVRLLNFMRAMLPIDATTVQGRTVVYTKDKGTTGMGSNSVILAEKSHVTSEPNNGAAPAPAAPPVPTSPVPQTIPGVRRPNDRRRLLSFW
ncbi:hypothetical protein COO60DRAFT_1473211 [Scenedesmus sp. NREL 46B-D3]|nr:hypothetical protein COO60DRAFT_1473211 [Scenedesmus sp. NREL 46B-D3]